MKRERWILPFCLAMPLTSLLASCAYTAPFRWVEPIPEELRTAVVTLSAVESRAGQRKAFFDDTKRVLADLPNQSGLLGYSFRFELIGRKAWTMTVWKDAASRDRFAVSPVHQSAVRSSRATAQNIRFISVEAAVAKLPLSWAKALRLLKTAPDYE